MSMNLKPITHVPYFLQLSIIIVVFKRNFERPPPESGITYHNPELLVDKRRIKVIPMNIPSTFVLGLKPFVGYILQRVRR